MNKALHSIEDAYSMTLNPTQDYFAQLQPLARDGELANKISSNKVLFRLCMIVDEQEREITLLKEDRIAIAKQLLELQKTKNDPTAFLE